MIEEFSHLAWQWVLKNLGPVLWGKPMFNYIVVTVKLKFKTISQKAMVSFASNIGDGN